VVLSLGAPAADPLCMRSVTGLCIAFGSFVGGYLPTLWGASSLGVESLLFAGLGGVAGVWLGVRLSQ
jgi:hypothetical protein